MQNKIWQAPKVHQNQNPKTAYVMHILNNKHEYGPTQITIDTIKSCKKGRKLYCWEHFYLSPENITTRRTKCSRLHSTFHDHTAVQALDSHTTLIQVYIVLKFCFEAKWVMVKFLGIKVPCTLQWPYTEGTWLYCDYFIYCIFSTVVVLTCFVMWGYVYVWVFWQLHGCFDNMCTWIYCVLYCLYCVCIVSCMHIYSYFFFVCTSVGESNGTLPPRTCPGCSVTEPYRSHDWALVPANPAS